jgi:ankyrin repeat protein
MNAAEWGHSDIIELLVSSGAMVNAKSSTGMTALMFAANEGRVEAVKKLLALHADVNAMNGYSALMLAVGRGHSEVVSILIAAKADVNAKSKEDETALSIAIKDGRSQIIRMLRNAGSKQ